MEAPGHPVRCPDQLRSQAILGCGDSRWSRRERRAPQVVGKRRHIELNDDANLPLPRGAGGELRRNAVPRLRRRGTRGEQRDQNCRDQSAKAPDSSITSALSRGGRQEPAPREIRREAMILSSLWSSGSSVGAGSRVAARQFYAPWLRYANQAGAAQRFWERRFPTGVIDDQGLCRPGSRCGLERPHSRVQAARRRYRPALHRR